MTVGIGAICDGGKAVVFAADRLITTSFAGGAIVHDGERAKIRQLTPSSVIASTGTLSDATFVFDRITGKPISTVAGAASAVCAARKELREQRVDSILEKKIRLNLHGLLEAVETKRGAYLSMLTEIQQWVFNLSFLVGGVDADGVAHLYRVDDDGIPYRVDDSAFAAIGSGESLAFAALAVQQYRSSWSSADAVLALFTAKRAAEANPNVGALSDIAIVTPASGVQFLPDDAIEVLSRVHKEIGTAPRMSERQRGSLNSLMPSASKGHRQAAGRTTKRGQRSRPS
jgi:20S proteasome alpha/beta subunit